MRETTSIQTMLPCADQVDSLRETRHPCTLVPLSLPAVDRSDLVRRARMARHFIAAKQQIARRQLLETTFGPTSLKNRDRVVRPAPAIAHT